MAKKDFEFFIQLNNKLTLTLSRWLMVPQDTFAQAKNLCQQDQAYQVHQKPKGNGQLRMISAPADELKKIQSGITKFILGYIPIHLAVIGCRRHTGFVDNARFHHGFAKSIYNLDLANAYPSISRSRIEKNLTGPINYQLDGFGLNLNQKEKNALVQAVIDLVTFKNSLPQGAPSSSDIMNIVGRKLDKELTIFIESLNAKYYTKRFRYSRYADDLTFSCNQSRGFSIKNRSRIKKIIRQAGWNINPKKEEYVPEFGNQKTAEITGIKIHNPARLTIARRQLHIYRTRLHAIKKQLESGDKSEKLIGEFNGLKGFIHQVYGTKLPTTVHNLVKEITRII